MVAVTVSQVVHPHHLEDIFTIDTRLQWKMIIIITIIIILSLNVILKAWVMQELVYSLKYVLEHMDLIRSWVDIEVEKVRLSVCVICAVRTVKV